MSKTKQNGVTNSRSEKDALKKSKDAGVSKTVQAIKSKSKDLAKTVTGKEEKKSKKKAKEPTPEPEHESEDSEEDEDSAEGSDAESESEAESSESSDSEAEQVKPVANGKSSVSAKVKPIEPVSDASESEDSSDSEAETAAKVPAKQGPTAAASSDSDSDASNSSESEDEVPAPSKTVKAAAKKEASVDSDSDDSSDAESESGPEEPVVSKKRKAEDESPFAAKKAKAEATTSTGAAAGGGTNLFVGNLSWNVDEEWLSSEFSSFGELAGVRIVTDRDSGRSKGFGYVEFSNAADAAKAYEAKRDTELDGRKINLDWASGRSNNGGGADRAQNRAKSFGDKVSPPSDTLFVGNLAFGVDQNTVSEAFGEFGEITGVRLPTDRETGSPKGFGYVTFASIDEAKAAYEGMQGYELEGRTVRLDYSQPRPSNGDFGGGGRGRGGFGGGRGGGRGGRGGFGDRGGRGGFGGRGGGRGGARGGRGGSTNRGGFGDFSGKKTSFD